jgi:uncharacterized membrane protein YgcG
MKGFMAKSVTAVCLAGGLAGAGGCELYRNLVDPCYPERYEFVTRQEVGTALAPQVFNGHVLDQTVWNNHFEPGTDKLTRGGMEHLAYLARRRPAPDGRVYLQTAQDLVYDPAAPEKFAQLRGDLDSRRIQVVQNYLTAQTAGRHLAFDVIVHDPSEVGMSAVAAGVSIQKMQIGFQGNLPTTAGAGGANVAGGGGAGGGGGGGGGTGGGGTGGGR